MVFKVNSPDTGRSSIQHIEGDPRLNRNLSPTFLKKDKYILNFETYFAITSSLFISQRFSVDIILFMTDIFYLNFSSGISKSQDKVTEHNLSWNSDDWLIPVEHSYLHGYSSCNCKRIPCISKEGTHYQVPIYLVQESFFIAISSSS